MQQPTPVAASRRAALLLMLFLALLIVIQSSAAPAGAMETVASAPAEPVGESHQDEADTEQPAPGRRAFRPASSAAPEPRLRQRPGTVGPAPYRPRTHRSTEPRLPPRTARCVVLRC
ncbi:hypothetical protein AB0D12_03805 [Streptomyces sp. NPDC048479]|uniref:hypothetical protein n=1 Tax=Streptomyces sp. NPDC048479 TaxID=3154725 RepID=UPI003434B354